MKYKIINFLKLFFITFFYCLIFHKTFGEEVKIYKPGKEPKLSQSRRFERTFATINMPQTPFFVKLKHIKQKYVDKKIKGATFSGVYKKEQGKKIHIIRFYIKNNSAKEYKDLVFHIQHFVYDLPMVQGKSGKTHVKRTSNKVKEYKVITFSIPLLKPNEQIIIDSPEVVIEYNNEKFIDDAYDRTHPWLDDTYCYEEGFYYAGFIASIFDKNGKLLYQQTNKRSLRKKGIKSL